MNGMPEDTDDPEKILSSCLNGIFFADVVDNKPSYPAQAVHTPAKEEHNVRTQ